MKTSYRHVRGTSDFAPLACQKLEATYRKAREVFKLFAYEEISLPVLEEKGLFVRSVGEASDIVERQMFKIEGKDIVLRPEGTAGVIRYYLQHSLKKQSDFYKFFYIGPMFRGERPQRGRLRQFHHIGAEAIGSGSFYLDAEIIALCLEILDAVGLSDRQLRINTLGCPADKAKFSKYLKQALKINSGDLCSDCRRRLVLNPLRVLDCKNTLCVKTIKSLDLNQQYLCPQCRKEFAELLSLLDSLGIEYKSTPYLVRGLDYYTHTVFEVASARLGSQDAVAAGGRYNCLVKSLGGPDTPAVGFAAGVERILLAVELPDKKQTTEVFVAVADKTLAKPGFSILDTLRKAGVTGDYDYCGRSLKGQLRFAQKKGVKLVVILGLKEWADGYILLKDMQSSLQKKVKIDNLTAEIKHQCSPGR